MTINTNTYGNYNILRTNNTVKANNVSKAKFDKMSEQITNEEKDFFAKMYPDKKQEIAQHHFYAKNGSINGVVVGSLFDRRG